MCGNRADNNGWLPDGSGGGKALCGECSGVGRNQGGLRNSANSVKLLGVEVIDGSEPSLVPAYAAAAIKAKLRHTCLFYQFGKLVVETIDKGYA